MMGRIELQSRVYILVNGNETQKISFYKLNLQKKFEYHTFTHLLE